MDSRQTKILLLGVGAAALLGLAAGGLATPDFGALAAVQAAEPQPAGPVRRLGHELATSWTSYTGDIPEYVIGTDWTAPPEIASTDEPPPPVVHAAPPPPDLAAVRAEAHAADAAAFADAAPAPPPPSMGGDILAGLDSYAPPNPPEPGFPRPPAN